MMKWLANLLVQGYVQATKFITTGGTSSQFVKGDGSLDNTVYSTQADINTAIDNIKIGGRNYLKKSDSLDSILIAHSGASLNVSKVGDYFNVTTTGGSSTIKVRIDQNLQEPFSEYYTCSFHVKNNKSIPFVVMMRGISTQEHIIPANFEGKVVFTRLKNTTSNALFYFLGDTAGDNLDFEITPIKIEEGNVATDWTPAPEDQISDWLQTEPTAFDFINNKPTKLSDFINDGYALDSDVVHKTGDENIDDKKRFLEHVRIDKGTVKIGNSLYDYYNPYSGYFGATNHNIFKIKLPLDDGGNANMGSLDLSIYDYKVDGYPANIILSFRTINGTFSSRDYAVTNSERILTLTLGIENGDLFLIIDTTGFNYPRIFINKYSSYDNILYKDIEVTSETSIDYSSFSAVQNVPITYLASKNWVNTQGFLTAETDPTVPSHVKAITTGDINDWNAAYDWVSLGGVSRTTTSLNSSNDLDLVVEPGYYHHTSGSAPLNTPRSGAGYLEVVNNADTNPFVRQAWRARNSIHEYQRIRNSSGIWSAWVQYITDENLDSQATSLGFIKSADLTGYVPTSRTITAGNGLSGGGNLSANRTITLGTPTAIGLSTTNSVTSTSHTHALDSATITAINQGVTAHGWGDFRDYGLGITGLNSISNIDDQNIPNGLYSVIATNTGFGSSGALLVERSGAANYVTQKLQLINNGDIVRLLIRHYKPNSSAWTPWREVITDGNLDSQATSLGFIKSGSLGSYVPTSRTITINGVAQNLSANRTWTIPDTITRLRGTASGTYTSGDLTLLAGANTTITQSGANITIASTNTNTTYTAGTGLSLSGTTFGQTITTSGTGTFVTGITQTTNGFQVNLGTLSGYATENWVNSNFDNYKHWNLKTNGVQRKTIQSGNDVDFVAGENITINYGADGKVTIESDLSQIPVPTLDQVTNVGNNSSLPISVRDGTNPLDDQAILRDDSLQLKVNNNSVYCTYHKQSIEYYQVGVGARIIRYPFFSTDGNIEAYIPITVNGVRADTLGNIEIDAETLTYPLIVVVDNSCYPLTNNARYLYTGSASEVCILADPEGSDEGKEILILNDTGTTLTPSISSGTPMRKLVGISGGINMPAGYKGKFRVINGELVEIG